MSNAMEDIIISNVEKICLSKSGRSNCKYIGENIPTFEVQNIYELGRLVALRFIEWVIENPTGVVALPTGRTPEFFIKTLSHLKDNWSEPSIQQSVIESGIVSCDIFPDMSGLTFVMLDEFFPMLPTHRNSFCNYIEMFYTSVMGISPENIHKFDLVGQQIITLEELDDFSKIDVDLTLLTRDGINEDEICRKNVLERVQKFCDNFETKIRNIGGIGFFLGGIGPDGHIAFNQEGCSHDTKTRLVGFNYATAAAAAGDLGGIEISRGKAAMTIGLETITYNKNATIIIMAAGEGKAEVVRAGIEDPIDNARPSSVLQNCKGGRFYITRGAANKLTARKCESLSNINADVLNWAMEHCAGTTSPSIRSAHMVVPPEDYLLAESIVYQLSLKSVIPVHLLSVDNFNSLTQVEQDSFPTWFKDRMSFKVFASCASRRLREKIEGGLRQMSLSGKSILHTAPHHDDIMLSYHAAMHELLGRQPGKI
jgi:6-phosphogluconolactonase/glucosamine-6-phosphate isomerase/deaminase